MTKIGFLDFLYLGADQGRISQNFATRIFTFLLGPLGIHARIRNGRMLSTILSFHQNLNNWRVLDVGCGYGYSLFWLARHFPKAQFIGFELNAEQSAQCEEIAKKVGLNNLTFKRGSAGDIPENMKFDLFISIDVLEHVQDDLGMLKTCLLHLKPGGWAFIHVPLRHQEQKRIFSVFKSHSVEDHVRDEYLPEEICQLVQDAGLNLVRQGYGFGYWGELAFELNNLFWTTRALRNLTALLFLPISLIAGYIDIRQDLVSGNSIIVVAQKP